MEPPPLPECIPREPLRSYVLLIRKGQPPVSPILALWHHTMSLQGFIDSSTSWAASKVWPRQTGADGAILVTQGATLAGYSAL